MGLGATDDVDNAGFLKGNRWLVLVFGMFSELCGGSIYVPGLYISDVQSLWFPGSGETEVQNLVFASNLGNWMPWAGFFYDWRHGGPVRTVLMASLFSFVGYGGLYLLSTVDGGKHASFWPLAIFWFIWGTGSGWYDNAAVSTTAHNFKHHRGRAMGLVKSFYGLSGSIIATLYLAFFPSSDAAPAFLLFLGIFLLVLGCASAPIIRRLPPRGSSRGALPRLHGP